MAKGAQLAPEKTGYVAVVLDHENPGLRSGKGPGAFVRDRDTRLLSGCSAAHHLARHPSAAGNPRPELAWAQDAMPLIVLGL